MSNEQSEKIWWEPHMHDQSKGLCTFETPDLNYRFYAKWDGEIHFWFDDDPLPRSLRDVIGKTDRPSYYWYIGDIEQLDEMIMRLHLIKETARKWFADKQELWPPDWASFCTAGKTIEEITRLPEDEEE